jgi:NADH-quinone oxidoreductase subunit N
MRVTVLAPEALVVGGAVGLLLAGSVLPRRRQLWLRGAALAVAVVALALELWLGSAVGTLFNGGWQQDRFALFSKAALLLGLTVLLAGSLEGTEERELSATLVPLTLLVVFGGMVAASASSLVALWAGLELAALAAVTAAGQAVRETGMRLLLLSAVAGALVAAGFAVLFAIAGGASLGRLQVALTAGSVSLPLALAVLLALAGIVVRLGLSPFQWATVEGGAVVPPLGAGALGGLLVGVAAVVAARLLSGLGGVSVAWAPWLQVLAGFAMLAGGLLAATARSPRGLVAWLIATQVGWLAAGLGLHDRRGTTGALLVLGALLLAAAAAPVLARGLESEQQLAGLRRSEPGRALGLAIVLLSLAGVPPLAGFVGEFVVAAELVRSQVVWLLAAGLLGSLLALLGVVRLLRLMYVEAGPDQPRTGRRAPAPVWSPGPLIPAALVLLYLFFANPISGLAAQGAAALHLP